MEGNLSRRLTQQEVAEMLNVSVGTVENWRYRGVGPAYIKLGPGTRGTKVRYRIEDVEAFERKMTVQPNTVQNAENEAQRVA